MTGAKEPAQPVQVTAGEARLAWGVLVVLAVVAHPARSHPGRTSLAMMAIALAPGALVLSSAKGGTRVADGLARLASEPRGRLALLGAAVLAILLGLTFDPFIAFILSGLFCSLLWSADVVCRRGAWERRFGGWIGAGLTTFLSLAAAEGVLAWGPVARRLGTPAELNQWDRRYDGVWGSRNLFHLRSPYEDTRRRPGVRRVIALGDSFTWGSKIASSDSTWPALLERALRGGRAGQPTEVVNMGHGGYASGNEAEELRRLGWQFDPDLVILQWLDNDAHVTRPDFRDTEQGPFFILVHPLYRTGWIRNSGLLMLLEHALTARFYGVLNVNRSHYAAGSPGWLELQRVFREMGDSAAQRCTPMLLVLYPYLFPGRWTVETYPEADIHRLVAAAGRDAGMDVLDLLPAVVAAGKDFKEWWGTAYDSHPGGAAQALAAGAIARYIREHALLAPGARRSERCPR